MVYQATTEAKFYWFLKFLEASQAGGKHFSTVAKALVGLIFFLPNL